MKRSFVLGLAVVVAAASGTGCDRLQRNRQGNAPPVPSVTAPSAMPTMAVLPSGAPSVAPSAGGGLLGGLVGQLNAQIGSAATAMGSAAGQANQAMATAASAMGSAADQANQAMASAAGAAGQTITIGATVSGQLVATDQHLEDGSVGDDYTLMLPAGVPVTIIARGGPSTDTPGTNLDAFLVLLQGTQQLQTDDDSAGDLNARIVFTPTVAGTYTIRVTTFGAGLKQGAYTLQVLPGAQPSAT